MLQNLMTKLVIICLTNKHNYKQNKKTVAKNKSLWTSLQSPQYQDYRPAPQDYINILTIWKLNHLYGS